MATLSTGTWGLSGGQKGAAGGIERLDPFYAELTLVLPSKTIRTQVSILVGKTGQSIVPIRVVDFLECLVPLPGPASNPKHVMGA